MTIHFGNNQAYVNKFKTNYKKSQPETTDLSVKPPTTEVKKPKKKGYFLGYLAGSLIAGFAGNLKKLAGVGFMNLLSKNKDASQLDKIEQATKEILKNTGLKDKGVEAIFVDSNNMETAQKAMNKQFKVLDKLINKLSGNAKEFAEVIANSLKTNMLDMVDKGQNAFYLDKAKTAVTGKANPGFIFHELGHALNATKPVTKFLQKYGRKLPILAGLLGTFSLFTTPKKVNGQEDKNELTFGQKTKNFIEKNIGLITLGSFAPLLFEEGLASHKGLKQASKHFKDLKPFKKLYAIGLASYTAGAGLLALGSHFANKAQNKVVETRTKDANV